MMQLILTDLDHTLLRQDGSISPESIRIIEACRAKGIRFAIATARYWIGAERYIRQLQPDYEITTDGTLVHARGACIHSRAFSAEDTEHILRRIRSVCPEASITVAHGKSVYWNSRHIADSEKLHKAVYCDFSAPLRLGANKIAAELPDEGTARQIAEEAGCRLQCYRGESLYAFLPQGAGKTDALEALCRAGGILPAEVVAFGDDASDIGLLQRCGKGVAVANALPEVLAAAADTTLSNDSDGVALWLNCHCLYSSLLSSTSNTRELGGHPLAGGGETQIDRIWRSDAPVTPDPADVQTLLAHRITTVIDLRTGQEAVRHPCTLAREEGFRYHHVPITTGSVPPETLADVPYSYLQIAASPETAEVLRLIAAADSGVLFCCTAGKDRTGVISALLLLACGVDRQTIVDDYVLSREYNRIRLERYLAAHPSVDRRIVLANEASMEQFLQLFLARYGSVEGFFAQAGLDAGELNAIRRRLLGAAPC